MPLSYIRNQLKRLHQKHFRLEGPAKVAFDIDPTQPVSANPIHTLPLGEEESAVELRPWLPTGVYKEELEANLREILLRMAYSLRGNNDEQFIAILQINHPHLPHMVKTPDDPNYKIAGLTGSEFFSVVKRIAEPYWEEFTWTDERGITHSGESRFQIWLLPAGRKPKLGASVLRYAIWGEDGTQDKWWGEIEYKEGLKNGTLNSNAMEPTRFQIGEYFYRTGLPHLAHSTKEADEFLLVPMFMMQPFVAGIIAKEGMLNWDKAKESPNLERIKPFSPGNPRVKLWISMDDTNFLAPGGGLYLLNLINEHQEFSIFQGRTDYYIPFKGLYAPSLLGFQEQWSHHYMWFTQRGLAKLCGGIRAFGKYASRTTDFDQLFSPRPGFPFGCYFTTTYLYSGVLLSWLTKLTSKPHVINDQQSVNDLFSRLIMGGFNSEDEIVSHISEDAVSLWSWVKKGMKWKAPWLFRGGPLHYRAFHTFKDTLLSQLASSKEPPLITQGVALAERPKHEPIILDDRPVGVIVDFWRWSAKWIPSFDIPQLWLRFIGKSVAKGARGSLLNDLVNRRLFGDILLLWILIGGFLYKSLLFGKLEVLIPEGAWWCTTVIILLVIHQKFTVPLLERIEHPSLFGYKFPTSLIMSILWVPVAVMQTLLVDVMHATGVLGSFNGATYPQILMKPRVVIKSVTMDLRRFIQYARGGSWLINPIEIKTPQIWEHLWFYRSVFTVGIGFFIIYILGGLVEMNTMHLLMTAVIIGIAVGPTAIFSHDYRRFREKMRKYILDGDQAGRNDENSFSIFSKRLWRRWARLEISFKWIGFVYPPIILGLLAAFTHRFRLYDWIPLHWMVLASPILLGLIAAPFASFLLSMRLKIRIAAMLNWMLGALTLALGILVHLPGMQPWLGSYLEMISYTPLSQASAVFGGHWAVGPLAPLLGTSQWFVLPFTLIVVSEVILLILGFFLGAIYMIWAIGDIWKEAKPVKMESVEGMSMATFSE